MLITVKHNPKLTPERAMEVFKKGFAGKYEVYKWTRPGGARDFVIKKDDYIAVAIKLKQEKDKTTFVYSDTIPTLKGLLLWGLWYSIFNRSKYQAIVNEVKAFIENAPEFK